MSIKTISFLAAAAYLTVFARPVYSETVTDLQKWTLEGSAEKDSSKVAPDGKPSFKLAPNSHAVLKLREQDGSGKLTLYVYDDATVAVPDKQKSVGPRWGFAQANGRVLVGGIMYARFFQPEGSLAIIDTKPGKGAWNEMKFAGARGSAGWKKWEFDYNPETGLKITIEGKEVLQKYFDWNASQAAGFNGIVLYGDATGSATPQTVWVGGITYELGPPMKVKPAGAGGASGAPGSVAAVAASGASIPSLNSPLLQPKESVVAAASASSASGNVADLEKWAVEGPVQIDPAKPGLDGKPSIKIGPKGIAVVRLREADGSGKVTLFIYDDGTVAVPDRQKSVGPRWGLTQANGRVLVGGIMYARFFQPEGSLAAIDTKPAKGWNEMKFVGPRGAAGWKKWEFDYNPETGLKITIDGKEVLQKNFDWNASQSTGFNGIVLYGDATGSATPQTIWVSGITYHLGAAMKVRPASMAGLPAPGQEGKAVPFPGPTLAADLIGLKVPVLPSYLSTHPRLLFSAADKEALQRKARENPKLWSYVMDSANAIKSVDAVPPSDLIATGGKYWRVEGVESGALAWLVTGDNAYRDGVVRWLLAYCRVPVWGTVFRPNIDLAASWNLYHVSVAYDILYNELSEADRKVIREGLASHAKAIYQDLDPEDTQQKITYDQNHTYIPTVGMLAASLALLGDVPEAQDWLNRGYAVLRRSRYVLGTDGYYYEGYGYWSYALHWHVRAADLISRATGEKMHDIPALRDNWLYAIYLNLPDSPGAFSIHDAGLWDAGQPRPILRSNNITMLWGIASATGSRGSQTAGNLYQSLQPEKDYPAAAFLWYNPAVKPLEMSEIEPFHYFPDHGVVSWRSGWTPEATCYLFRCGPPEGHEAAAKVGQLHDWIMNAGHVHPNIGAFWMYAKGTFMAVDTGYTAQKWTRDHNTLLIDDKGQGVDGSYHNEHGLPYNDLDQARIDCSYLCNAYGYASGEFGSAYTRQVPGVKLRRSVLMTERWLLVLDEMSAAQEHKLTWICHTDAPFQAQGSAFVAHLPKASLAVLPLTSIAMEPKTEPTVVMTGLTIGEVIPDKGRPIQHGYHLGLTMAQPSKAARLTNLLVPLGKDDKLPAVRLVSQEKNTLQIEMKWPGGKVEDVQLDQAWQGSEKPSEGPGPATIRLGSLK